jgi:pyroglutamyl-peptidase
LNKVLVTGFGPFANEKVNPALEVIKQLSKEKISTEDGSKITLKTIELPVVFGDCIDKLGKEIKKFKPNLVLSIGQAGGRSDISIEKVGLNLNHASIPDNDGNKPNDQPIAADGPVAYYTTIDVRKTYEDLKEAGIPAQISYSAGTYVCNNITYGALHYLATKQKDDGIKYGFIHIPFLPSQAANKRKPEPSMALSLVLKAIKRIILVNLDD